MKSTKKLELEKDVTYMQVNLLTNEVWRLQKNKHYINFSASVFFNSMIYGYDEKYYITIATPEMDKFMEICIQNKKFMKNEIPNRIITNQHYEIY